MNHALYIAIPSATIALNSWAAGADFAKLGFVVKNSDDLGVARLWLPLLGALKAAGAVGLLLGLFGIPAIGTAAAAGLVLFFVSAIVAHVRAGVLYNIAFPAVFLGLAVGSLLEMGLGNIA
ncbi:MAG: DoxX family protein [Candidatus Cybelea sp.]